jgi:trans-2,3-dihydro-3-hydroxyanthranilate isomerase
MNTYPIAYFDAFSNTAFGGSQAAVITDASSIDFDQRQKIAREIGMPATAFVNGYGDDWIDVQFMSTVMELPMCGHGTICLVTRLTEPGFIECGAKHDIELRLPKGSAMVEVYQTAENRTQVMLDIEPPVIAKEDLDLDLLYSILGLNQNDIDPQLPVEIARGDFIHLQLPLKGLEAMRRIQPKFAEIIDFCHVYNIETITPFTLEVENQTSTVHVRDFCPAVGVAESAAAGTTNAALTTYLLRHDLVETVDPAALTQEVFVVAEQGHEISRPSQIKSKVTLLKKKIQRLQVGGVATKTMEGVFCIDPNQSPLNE